MLKQEQTMLKIAIITSLIGLLTLIIISNNLAPEENTPIDDVDEQPIGSSIKITGTIKYIKITTSITIITLEDYSGSIKVIAKTTKEEYQEKLQLLQPH